MFVYTLIIEEIKNQYFLKNITLTSNVTKEVISETPKNIYFIKATDVIVQYLLNNLKLYKDIKFDPDVIRKGKIVKTSDIILNDEVVYDGTLDEEELEFLKYKNNLLKKINNLIQLMNIQNINLFYINYLTLHDYFASKNIYITPENKEDMFLEIIELDDDTALDKLEKYLKLMDIVYPKLDFLNKIIELHDELEYAFDKEELENINLKFEKLNKEYNILTPFQLEAIPNDLILKIQKEKLKRNNDESTGDNE